MQQKQPLTDNSGKARPENTTNKPLVTCSYGWKRTCVLYNDRIDVDGTIYALDELVHVRAIYRTVMNIPSVRLELRFRKVDVTLRGIAAIEDAKSIIAYLETYCEDTTSITSRSRRHRDRSNTVSTTGRIEAVSRLQQASIIDKTLQTYTQAVTAPIEAPTWLQDLEQHVIYTRSQQRTKAHRSIRKYGFDVHELAQEAEAATLPSVAVPLRLLPQESAHYCTDVTLSRATPVTSSTIPVYTAADQGRLILTSKRAIFMGRAGQIVLDYARLTNVSRLRNAIIFSADTGSKRHVFEMQRPLECALYLDGILRQFQRHQRASLPAQPPAYVPGLQHTSRTTQARYAAHGRQTTHVQTGKHVVEVEDIETLPLSLLAQHAEFVQ